MGQVEGHDSLRHFKGVWRCRAREDIQLIRWTAVRTALPRYRKEILENKLLPKGDNFCAQLPHFVGGVGTGTLMNNPFGGQKLIEGVVLELISVVTP